MFLEDSCQATVCRVLITGERMKLTELRYLVALSKTKHFGQAATLCHVSQPTLSVAINKLESKLGVSLFERFHHEVRITDIGQQIVAQAVIVLEEVDKIAALSEANSSQLSSPLNLWAIYTVAPYLFPRLIPIIRDKAPDMPLMLGDAYTEDIRQKMIQGDIDIAILAMPFSESGIVTRTIYKEKFVCLLPIEHRLAQYDAVNEQCLSEENVLLLAEGHCFRDQVLKGCPSCQSDSVRGHHVEGTSIETLKQMVASGLGITVLPMSAAFTPGLEKYVAVKPFKGISPCREIALAWRVSFPRPKVIDVLVDALKSANIDGSKLEL